MSRVRVKRYWEVSCELHGVVDMCHLYKDAKRVKEQHRADHPECFEVPSLLRDSTAPQCQWYIKTLWRNCRFDAVPGYRVCKRHMQARGRQFVRR